MISPTILCEPTGFRTWRFFCPFCRSYHQHGGEPDARGEIGHRGAHCLKLTSPYRATGYILKVKQVEPA
jgi:hypothetical protein